MKVIGVFLIFFNVGVLCCQENDEKIINLSADLGYKYLPYIGGPIFGLSYYNLDRKIGVHIRYDIVFKIERDKYVNSNLTFSYKDSYVISEYNTFGYITIDYRVLANQPLMFGTGIGWIYNGEKENVPFNKEYGYAVLTTNIGYRVSWINFELRGDIPLTKEFFMGTMSNYVFPLSICVYYELTPKKF